MPIGKGPRPLHCFGPCYHVRRRFNLADMTDSFVSSSPETQFPCPFEDKDVWPQYWKCPGKFRKRMLNAQQSNQICAYFQEAKLLQQQGHSRSKSYRFEMQSLAQYFGKERSVFSKVVTNSIQYKELMSRSSAQQVNSAAQQTNSTDLSPAIPIIADEAGDAEVDGKPLDGCGAELACSAEQATFSPRILFVR